MATTANERQAAQAAAKARYSRALMRMNELSANHAREVDYMQAVADAAEAETALTAMMQEQI
jgi:hypothetical protein